MRVKFWGVRGSIPTPEHRNSRYGGNTGCIEIRLENGTLIILDCGSGLRGLGNSLVREFGQQPITGYIFLTHFHWDHIQGIPFFSPLYRSGNEFYFHAVQRKENELNDVIQGQITNPYFPVDMRVLSSSRRTCDLDFGPKAIGGATIRSAPLNHPQGCVAYRIDADGSSFVLATDTEPGSQIHDSALRHLAEGADVLVYDAQYTPAQLEADKRGWGHSSWLEGTRIARECGVKKLILHHHDPEHDDDFVDDVVEQARGLFPNTMGAAEGLELRLPQEEVVHAYRPSTPRKERRYNLEVPVRVSWRNGRGEKVLAEGFTRNISKSTIYLMTSDNVPLERPLEIDLALPCEIREYGMLAMRFTAQAIRKEDLAGSSGREAHWVGLVARMREELPELSLDTERIAADAAERRNGNHPMTGEDSKMPQKVMHF